MMRFAVMTAVALTLLVGGALIPALSQEKKPAGDIDFAKVQEEFMKLHTPGAEHKVFQEMAGEYSIKGKMWQAPGTDPVEVHGWSTMRTVGTAFAHEKMTVVMPDNTKMWGEGFFGFDNESKLYQTTWIGGWSTTQRTMSGTMDAKTGVMELKCSYTCPITKKAATERVTATPNEDGTLTLRMYAGLEGVGEFQNMEMVYTLLK